MLRQWILSGKWRNAFDSASLSRGRAYASDRFIRELAIGVGPAGDLPVCSASVIGTAPNPYGTDVIFRQVNGVWSVDPDS